MTNDLTISTKEEFEKILSERDSSKRFLEFNNCKFLIDIEVQQDLIGIDCKDCIFEKTLKLNNRIFQNLVFKNCVFKDEVDLSDFLFKRKARFHECKFHERVYFDNTKFDDLADFWRSEFFKPTIFFKTDFLATTVFSATTFHENVLFTYSLVKAELILRGTIFKSGLDLSLMILTGNINIFDIKLSNYSSINYIKNDEYEDAISDTGLIPHQNKRESFRILKKELRSQGNSIDALTFMALEKKSLQEQLISDFKTSESKLKNLQDRFILKLSSLSNGYGESWGKGVLFTFSVGLLVFYFSILSTEKYLFSITFSGFNKIEFLECVEYFFKFMLPTHSVDYLSEFKPTWYFYILDMIGRIFISFGIYQTIFAFRKYHSK